MGGPSMHMAFSGERRCRLTLSATNGPSREYSNVSLCLLSKWRNLNSPRRRPFPYLGHTQIPLTMEKSCLQLEVVPHDQRKNEVTVLGKLFGEWSPSAEWDSAILIESKPSRVLLPHELCSSRYLAFLSKCDIFNTYCQRSCSED